MAVWTGVLILMLVVSTLYVITNPIFGPSSSGSEAGFAGGMYASIYGLFLAVIDIVVILGYLFMIRPKGIRRIVIGGLFLAICMFLNSVILAFLPFYLPHLTFSCDPHQSNQLDFISCEDAWDNFLGIALATIETYVVFSSSKSRRAL
jgi:hypothetical protein